ncbi:MAG: PD-(D/E)XK nuclease family transposase [Clostridiales bacterium]|nr:PD-(D/E)XK nuclease family transposase [Clostridiales bacterium]
MAKDRILPTNDLMFKKAFASEGSEDITIGLIQDFFGFAPKELVLKMPYSIDSYLELLGKNDIATLRQTIKDVRASLVASDFIAELQIRKTSHYDKRAFYYLCDDYCGNYNLKAPAGPLADAVAISRYASLKPVFMLNILGYNHYTGDERALRIFEPYDPERQLRPTEPLYRQAFFELRKAEIETENQRHWRDFFVSGEVADTAPEYIKGAGRLLAEANLSRKEKEAMDIMEKATADYEAELAYARLQGIEEGHQRGVEEMARKMLAKNIHADYVQEITGLGLEAIKDLQMRMN